MPALLVLCFTLSGATSLVLQVVWVRRLIGVFGASSLAIATVLATFMAGLAIGSWLGGRLADKVEKYASKNATKSKWSRLLSDPFFYYGMAELLVGITALLILPIIDHYQGANAWLWQQLGDTPWILAGTRFLLTATVLIIPTTAMGATLPLLTRKITRDQSDVLLLGKRLGILYAFNTAGALCGAASAGFWLIPLFGVSSSNQLAAGGAIVIGSVIAVLAWFQTYSTRTPVALPKPVNAPPISIPKKHKKTILWLYALSGGVAMVLEVLWSRTLAIVNGSSVYSFTIVLCTFLVGISVGSAFASKFWNTTKRPLTVLSWLFLFSGFGILLFHYLADDLPKMFLALVEGTHLGVETVLFVHILLSAFIIIPAALTFGAVMPIAIRAYVGNVEHVGADVGRAYAANTIGAIVGSIAGGFIILPGPGLELGVRLCAVIMILLSTVSAFELKSRNRIFLCALLLLIATWESPAWNRSNLTSGLFRTHQASSYIKKGGLFQRNIVYYRDGISTTVSVEKLSGGWVLRNNGKVEASNRHDMPTQILVGLLPSMFHPSDSQKVFLVGYGSGVTVGSMAIAPMVKEVDVVELEPAVYEAADLHFSSFNNEPHKNKKVRRLLGDGRNVLLAGGKRYDIIVSEPSNPWIAGVATLFTREFYTLAKKHLEPKGIFCQWAQLYELGPSNVKMIYRTFAESFQYVYAFTPGDETTDTVLIGSDSPIPLHLPFLRKRIASSKILQKELERAEIRNAEDLVASILLTPSEVDSFTAGAKINTDDNAALEYSAPHDLLASANTGHFARLVRGDSWPYGYLQPIVSGVEVKKEGDLTGATELRIAFSLMTYGRLSRAAHWIQLASKKGADTTHMTRVHALALARDFSDPELAITEGGTTLPTPSRLLFQNKSKLAMERLQEGYYHFANGHWNAGWNALRNLPRRVDSNAGRDITLLMGYLAYKALDLNVAQKLLQPLLKNKKYVASRPSLPYYVSRSHLGLGHFRDAINNLDVFAKTYPEIADECIVNKL